MTQAGTMKTRKGASLKLQRPPKNRPYIDAFARDIRSQHALRSALWAFVLKHTGTPALMDWVSKLIQSFNIKERDEYGLAEAIQKYSQEKIKYFRENPERFVAPLTTIKWGIGDCDDKSILIATVLRSFKIPVRLVFIVYSVTSVKTGNRIKKSHVYPQAKLDGNWVSLESVRKLPMGIDPYKLLVQKGFKPEIVYVGDK
jgi:transglutaminase-like putative cysteine protease